MSGARIGEVLFIVAIVILVAAGGQAILAELNRVKLLGALVTAGALIAALGALRTAYDPADPSARVNTTKYAAYTVAAAFALWAVLAPARWNVGVCIVAVEVALVFDLVATVARGRLAKE